MLTEVVFWVVVVVVAALVISKAVRLAAWVALGRLID